MSDTFAKINGLSWEQGPLQLIYLTESIPATPPQQARVVTEIAIIQNCLIRALNSVYIQASHIPLNEYANFTSYCLATYHGLLANDSPNEQTFFSKCVRNTGQTLFMSGHSDFDNHLTAWGNWLQSIANKRNNFSPSICQSMIDGFMPALQQHLQGLPGELALSGRRPLQHLFDIAKGWEEHKERVFGSMSKTELLPLFLMNHDSTFGGDGHGFPKTSMLPEKILREVYARKNGDWWKFSTVGFDGKKREAKFL